MPLSLAKLQSNFARALHYQASADACGIVSDHFSGDQRLQIYRNNFVIALSEILALIYPKVLALVGEECFAQIARQHVLTQPLCEGSVVAYGQGFAQSITQFEQVQAQAPYLSDMAQLEWCLDLARQVRSGPAQKAPSPLAEMAAVPAEQQSNIELQVQPSCQLIASPYAVIQLWHAINNQQYDQLAHLDLSRAEQGALFIDQEGQAHAVSLTAPAFELLCACVNPHTLGSLPDGLLPHLTELVTQQLIIGFELTNKESNHES